MQLRGKVRAVCVTDGEGLGLSCSGVIPKLEVTQMASRGWVDKARCIFRMECYPTVKKKNAGLCEDREGPPSDIK